MPRQPRLDLPGIAQHVIQRGNDRQPCFFRDVDRMRYLTNLREAAIRCGCAVHAYVLMTNHVQAHRHAVGPRFQAAIAAQLGRCATPRPARRPTAAETEQFKRA